MNINTTMLLLWNNHQKLEYLAQELGRNGFGIAQSELNREQIELGKRLMQIEGVLGQYQQDIATTQHYQPENPPRFIGVDMGKPEGDRTCFKEVKE